MTGGRIALMILGILLLAPGLCGAFALGANTVEHMARMTFRYTDYEEIVWVIAQPSFMAGCLGVFIVASATGRQGWWYAARIAGWVGLAITVYCAVFAVIAGWLRSSTGMTEGLMMSVFFAIAFAIGCLPGLLMKKPQTVGGQ